MHAGQVQPVCADLRQLLGIVRNAAARAAQGIRGAHDHRIAYLLRKGQRLFHFGYNFAFNTRLPDGLHGFLKRFPVLRFPDGIHIRAQKLHAHLFQKAAFRQLHGQV